MRLHVVAAVLRDGGGRVLVQQRAPGSHLAGLWEFPGGKVEVGESVADALARELIEELGIRPRGALPWLSVNHDYEDRRIDLDVWRVPAWDGSVTAREGQPLRWLGPEALTRHAMPAADLPVVRALAEAPA